MFNIGDLISLSGQNFTSNFPTRIKNLDVENTDNGSFKAPIQPLTMNKKNIFEIQSFHWVGLDVGRQLSSTCWFSENLH